MTTIWKYTVPLYPLGWAEAMPSGARLVSVGNAGHPGAVNVWAIVDPEAPSVVRKIAVTGTGRGVPDDGVFVGTVDTGVGLIWHVWDLGEDAA